MIAEVRRRGIDVRQIEATAQAASGSAGRRVRTDGATPW
jgi:hypothetical protein